MVQEEVMHVQSIILCPRLLSCLWTLLNVSLVLLIIVICSCLQPVFSQNQYHYCKRNEIM